VKAATMAEVTNELIYEVLKRMHRLGGIEHGVHEVRSEIVALRGHVIALQQDVANIYGRMANVEVRLDRIERRLDIVEAPPHGI
jgi:tetrahydromethanopterin S-methyltransferase subunit G